MAPTGRDEPVGTSRVPRWAMARGSAARDPGPRWTVARPAWPRWAMARLLDHDPQEPIARGRPAAVWSRAVTAAQPLGGAAAAGE
jgi:hypothetical protein